MCARNAHKSTRKYINARLKKQSADTISRKNFVIGMKMDCIVRRGFMSSEKSFEIWWDKLQTNSSIAAWMISASLPKGIAKTIWDARQPKIETLQKQVKDCKEILEKLRTLAWQDRDYEMYENLNTFLEVLCRVKRVI